MLKHLKILCSYHELLANITLRDIKARYKQSLLGTTWAIIQSLSLMLIFTVVFSKFLRMPTTGLPYPIFAYCALLPWSFFSNALTFAVLALLTTATSLGTPLFEKLRFLEWRAKRFFALHEKTRLKNEVPLRSTSESRRRD